MFLHVMAYKNDYKTEIMTLVLNWLSVKLSRSDIMFRVSKQPFSRNKVLFQDLGVNYWENPQLGVKLWEKSTLKCLI